MSNGVVIQKFVSDFKLRQPDGVVGFAARIKFHINGHVKTRFSQVQILLGDKLNTIYLISPDLPFEDLPDTFMARASTYKYKPNDHLSVISKEEPENFVEIYPVVV